MSRLLCGIVVCELLCEYEREDADSFLVSWCYLPKLVFEC